MCFSEMLTEENSSHTQLVGKLSNEKEALQGKIDQLTAQIAEVDIEMNEEPFL